MTHAHVDEALQILADIGLPRAQRNERSALTLLALTDLRPERAWKAAGAPLMGITPIMDWIREHYARTYAPNTRETIRRQTMHQFVQANLALYNPDDPCGRSTARAPSTRHRRTPWCCCASTARPHGTWRCRATSSNGRPWRIAMRANGR